MATASPIVTRKTKYVADGRVALSFTDADLPGATAGDMLVAVVVARLSYLRLTTSHDWTALKLGSTPEAPVEGSTGSVFDHSADGLADKTFGAATRPFVLFQPYVSGRTLTFTTVNSSSGNGGYTQVFLYVLRDAADQPIAAMPTPVQSSQSSLGALLVTGATGYPSESSVARIVWGAPSSSAAQTIGVGTGYEWGNDGATITGDVVGGRSTTLLAGVAASGTCNDLGVPPFGDPSFSPTVVGGGALTLAFAARVPLNFVASPPSISGTMQGGETVTADPGKWVGEAPVTYTYEFEKKVGATVTSLGAASSTTTFAVQEGQVGAQIRVKVVATNADAETATAYSAWGSTVITGTSPSPTGRPGITGHVHTADALAIVNELLAINRSNTGYSWSGNPTLTTQWGRAADDTLANVTVVSTGDTRAIVTDDIGRHIAVREIDATGAYSAWSLPVKAVRPVSEATDLTVRKPALDTGGTLVPGDPLGSADTTFEFLNTTYSVAGAYYDYSLIFLGNEHPDLELSVDVWIVANTDSPDTLVEFAVAADEALSNFDPHEAPAIDGSWEQPTEDDPLTLTIPPASARAIARRRTLAQNADGTLRDGFFWNAAATVAQP